MISLICSTNALLLLQSWLQYDTKFRILAAADSFFHYDQQHPDIRVEYLP